MKKCYILNKDFSDNTGYINIQEIYVNRLRRKI